jgi:prepilin-type N-terminal cleavage/methylation domain-containing protein
MRIMSNSVDRPNKSTAGFTIIETMIVLAIAGLMLTLVLLALTGLERSGHNSQRTSNANSALQLISEYMLNNSGNLPTSCGPLFNPPALTTCNAGTNLPDLTTLPSIVTAFGVKNVGIYATNAAAAASANFSTNNIFPTATAKADWLSIYNYVICNSPGSNPIVTTTGAGYNDIAAIYSLQSGSGWQVQCQQLR